MTRRELALLHTARSTNVCLDRHQGSWKNLPGFARQREVIRKKVAELDKQAGNAAADRGNLAGQRQNAIQALAEEAWIVAGQLQAWAAERGNEELRNEVRTSRDELVWLQMSLPERALQIHQRASEVLRGGNGADFGLSAARLDRLAGRIQALKILRVPPARHQNGAEAKDGALAGGLNQVMDLFCEVTDPLVRRFRVEEPEFFEDYQLARRIVDPETGTLLTSEEELASLDEDFPASSEGSGQSGPSWRSLAPPAGARSKKGAAALNS